MVCPDGYVMIWNPYERFLWGIAIVIALMCGIYFINIARKREIFNERIIMLGLACLPLGFALSLFFTFIKVLLIPGSFVNNTFCGDYNLVIGLRIYEIFGKLSYITFGIGGTLFVLTFEIVIKRTKYLLTITFLFLNIIIIWFPFELARSFFNFILIPELIFLVPFVLFLYTKWSHLEFKAVSSFLLFGFVLFMISLILAERAHKLLNFYLLILSPLLFILGCSIILLPVIIDPKIISRALTYWILFAILTFPFLLVIIIIDIIEGLIPYSGNWVYYIMLFFIAFFYVLLLYLLIIRDIKTEITSESQKASKLDEEYKTDFLAMFTRPQQVNFLASISHELRTPLTSIIGFTRTLLSGNVGNINEEQEKQLIIVLNSANHLHELINDVIDMTKIEVNKLSIKKEKFDLVEELIKIKETFNIASNEKGLEFFLDTPESLIIYNDKKRVNQILLNLIGNAVKFTDKGKIILKIKLAKREITISVKDTGPGIKQEDFIKLFKPFSRVLEPGKYREGSGLGLHLSKKLANLLGGDITVKSKLDKGSTFKLILTREDEEITS
jgi:signal transduction histidine kinase